MSRRPKNDIDVPITIGDVTFRLATSTMTALPTAPLFLRYLLDGGVSVAMAAEYARLAAKCIREGTTRPEQLLRMNERTAMNRYWKWIETVYAQRVQPVRLAIPDADLRQTLGWLRVHSLVPPYDGKTVPRLTRMPQLHFNTETMAASMEPMRFERQPCAGWTLHVPLREVPVHVDPCDDCAVYDLTPAQVEVIATAFKDAWGHTDLSLVPAESPLFGTQPLTTELRTRAVKTNGRTVGMLHVCDHAEYLITRGAHVATTLPALLSRLDDAPADVLVLSRELIGAERYDAIVQVLRS